MFTDKGAIRFGSKEFTATELLILGLSLATLGLSLFGVISWSFFSSLLKVLRYNTGFWLILVLSVFFGLYRKLSYAREFAWKELVLQLWASFIVFTILFLFFFSTSVNLTDTEIWNGYVINAEYFEEWTELVHYTETTTDSNGNEHTVHKTREDYHPPEWNITTSMGTLSVSSGVYNNYARTFGNQRKILLFRSGQCSFGDGNKYEVSCPTMQVPASQERYYVNYLKASDSIRKINGDISGYRYLLMDYPTVHSGNILDLGPKEVDRVIDAGAGLPDIWKKEVDDRLDAALTSLGSLKQVNILVYVVPTTDQGFASALENYWVRGKKNDVIVVLGITQFPKVDFVYVMAWTKSEEFKIALRNRLLDLKEFDDPRKVAYEIVEQVRLPDDQGGFKRMPMSDMEYLIADIQLPLWCQLLIVVIGGAASWGVSLILINNSIYE